LDGSMLILQVDRLTAARHASGFRLVFMGGIEVRPSGLRYVALEYPYDGPLGPSSIDLQRDGGGRPMPLAEEPPAFIEIRSREAPPPV
jgi:hypothetical protein